MKLDLSDRELAVITHAARGYTDEMIAHELGIQCGTVNSYWVRIRGKLGNLSRTELVADFVQKNADNFHADYVAQMTTDAEELGRDTKMILGKANAEIQRLTRLLAKNQSADREV